MKTFRREAGKIYLWAILGVMPILFKTAYEDVYGIKETFFLFATAVYIICSVIAIIARRVSFSNMGIPMAKPSELAKGLNVTDWCMIVFGFVFVMGTLTTKYDKVSILFGLNAVFMGTAMMFSLVVVHFLISRGIKAAEKGFFYGFLISSAFVFGIGLLNHMEIDPLGMHYSPEGYVYTFMISTIGNIDHYYGYLALPILFFALYRADMENNWKAWLVDAGMILMYLCMWTTTASGLYLGLVYGLSIMLAVSMRSVNRIRNLFWQGILAGIAGVMAEILCRIRPQLYKGMDEEFSGWMMQHYVYAIFGVLCLVIWLGLTQLLKKEKTKGLQSVLDKIYKPYSFVSLLLLIVGSVVIMTLLRWKVIDDVRSVIWDDTQKIFARGSLVEKLFGTGLGSMDLVREKLKLIKPDIIEAQGLRYETAHNDILNYLLEAGLLGMLSYIGIAVSTLFAYIRTAKDHEYEREIGCCAAVFAAYLGQSMVNGPNPVPTIISFIFIALLRRYQIPDSDDEFE